MDLKKNQYGNFSFFIVFLSFLYPFLNLDFFSINPVESILHYSGQSSMRFMLLTLAISPIIKLFKKSYLIFFRKTFGLASFFYCLVHFLVYFIFELEKVNLSFLYFDALDRPFIFYGLMSFFCLIPLAITSNQKSIKKMGSVRWKKLHQLIYVSFAFSSFHYYFKSVSKEGPDLAFVYISIGLFLLFFRAFKFNFRSRISH
tara:strand:- start:8 stop:610 length:603 start_codon:yes stop_codon:yes gene_type:complete